MSGPLAGIQVLDLSRILAGPWAGQLLADYGADVIKVERPGHGDDTRRWGPPWLRDKSGDETSDAAYFLAANRNKRSLCCELSHPDGAGIVRALAAESDVVIENFRVGGLQKYALDSETLRAAKPELIYCSITAYGQTGTRAGEPGYDAMIQAEAGLMSVTGEPASENGRPLKVGVAIADIMAGMYASTAILAALHERDRTGRGQHIDVPLFDSQVAWLANQAMNYLVSGEVPVRHGSAHPNIVPYQTFRTKDGDIALAVGNDQQFRKCAKAVGLPELADDERFSTNADRLRHREVLVDTLAERLRGDSTEHWLRRFRQRGVPAGPVNDLAQVFADDHTLARKLVQTLPHAVAGTVPTVVNPVRFSGSEQRAELAPPVLGEHTEEILRERLGYSTERIARLRADGAI